MEGLGADAVSQQEAPLPFLPNPPVQIKRKKPIGNVCLPFLRSNVNSRHPNQWPTWSHILLNSVNRMMNE